MKSFFRFLSRNKLYTLINIAGLVVSLMFIILMGDYTWRQYSIDSWHKNTDRIYLMGEESYFFLWPQAAEGIKKLCPDVEQTCCVMSQMGRIKYGDKEVKDTDGENGIIMLADSTFFQFFDFSYRIALSPWIFAAAGFTCFIISLLTVIVQSWRAASENPINNIKTE